MNEKPGLEPGFFCSTSCWRLDGLRVAPGAEHMLGVPLRCWFADEEFAPMLGHTKATMTGRYGTVKPMVLAQRVAMIEAIPRCYKAMLQVFRDWHARIEVTAALTSYDVTGQAHDWGIDGGNRPSLV